MRAAVLGFVLGVALLQSQGVLPAAWALATLGGAGMLAWFGARALRHAALAASMRALAGSALGFVWAAGMAHVWLAQALPPGLEGRDLVLSGVIDSLPALDAASARFNFLVEQPQDGAGQAVPGVPARIALGWYAPRAQQGGAPARPLPEVRPGERWQFTARLQRPHGNANPMGFDYEVWLLEQRVRATGYVRGQARRLDAFVPGAGHLVERARAILRTRIEQALAGKRYAGVIVALVIGDQRAVGQDDWQVFARSGVSHLISISGLHITMIAGLMAGLVAFLWRHSFFTRAQLPLYLPAQKVAAIAAVATALLYVLLAGFGVPAQRTLYMLTAVAAALWSGRRTGISQVLCLALLAVLLPDPWALLWPGFWLSFGAVAAILFATAGRTVRAPDSLARGQRVRAALLAAAHVQYVVTVALVPLTVLLFSQVSLVAPLANALAIPVISLLVTPLALLGAVAPAPLSDWLLGAAQAAMALLAQVLEALAAPALAVWSAPAPGPLAFALAFGGTLWLLMPRGWPQRALGLVLFLPLLLEEPSHPRPGALWVTASDVGQGAAVLLETATHRLLYDTGPAYSPQSDGASRVLVPYLKARGIAGLDTIIVSHNDNDHSGGALTLLRAVVVGQSLSSLDPASPIVRAAPHHAPCVAGQRWEWDGIAFEMLHPTADSYQDDTLKPNARSCTLKVTAGARSILLAGDIEAAQERALVAGMRDKLASTVLLAPHHGSGTSSTPVFLAAVQPQVAIFQVGYRNRYHHPKGEVWERYGELGIRRWRNDWDGALSLRFEAGMTVAAYREQHRRYWYGR